MISKDPWRFAVGAAIVCLATFFPGNAGASEVKVVRNEQDGCVLLRDGRPYVIRGAGGTSHLALLKENGGNSIRTWGIGTLEDQVEGRRLIDRCSELGLTITAGIHIGHERHGFNYSDPAQINRQREMVRSAVRKYKDHPALLIWGLGNEMEGPLSDGRQSAHIWKELNELAAIVKMEDPAHPVMTVIAGAAPAKVQGILKHYPNIDILGVNAYAGAADAATAIEVAGWQKPFVLSEFGPTGHWESPRTTWGTPIEPSSRAKADSYYSAQKSITLKSPNNCLGSYCFYWGEKQETTSTWYGMFLKSGEKLPQVDSMCRAWTDRWPTNRCPSVIRLDSELKNAILAPGQICTARAEANDPEGDQLQWEWKVTAESSGVRIGGDKEEEPPSFPDAVVHAENNQAVIRTPAKPGNYRLFTTVRDGKGGASTENLCFRVKPLSTE